MTGIAAVHQTLRLARRSIWEDTPIVVGVARIVLPYNYGKGPMPGWP
jgi:hypothetical protein